MGYNSSSANCIYARNKSYVIVIDVTKGVHGYISSYFTCTKAVYIYIYICVIYSRNRNVYCCKCITYLLFGPKFVFLFSSKKFCNVISIILDVIHICIYNNNNTGKVLAPSECQPF